MKFFKCQSLGNDFLLFDWMDSSGNEVEFYLASDAWPEFIMDKCNRRFGVGADGILIVRKDQTGQVEAMIFNADGSNGDKCLNGLRCVANYLFANRKFPQEFSVVMAGQANKCVVTQTDSGTEIVANVGKAVYKGVRQLFVIDRELTGYIIDIGNPHFVVLEQVTLNWLNNNGGYIEQHEYFPNRTNTEFVWFNDTMSSELDSKAYDILVYERGCGVTLACGTGAAAVMQTLFHLKKIQKNEKVIINMQGGALKSYIDNKGNIIQQAPAAIVFTGIL